jgi:hypothetical protein
MRLNDLSTSAKVFLSMFSMKILHLQPVFLIMVISLLVQSKMFLPDMHTSGTHGLSIEHEIDNDLGITDRRQILEMIIGIYNEKWRAMAAVRTV